MYTVRLVKGSHIPTDFRDGFFPRKMRMKKMALALIDEVEAKGGKCVLERDKDGVEIYRTDECIMDEQSNPWWKATAEQHARDYEQVRLCGGVEGAEKANLLVDSLYEPNLMTGRCRCKACKAAREHQQQSKAGT